MPAPEASAASADQPAPADETAGAERPAPADETASADQPAPVVAADEQPERSRTPWRQASTLLVAAVILAGFAAWAAVHAHSLRAGQADSNLALTDKALTRQVTTQVSSAVSTIFSYSYANPAATRQAAQKLLTGSAISQYNNLFALVEQKAPAEKLVLSTKVTDVGIELLTAGRARLLVFVNQQDKAGGPGGLLGRDVRRDGDPAWRPLADREHQHLYLKRLSGRDGHSGMRRMPTACEALRNLASSVASGTPSRSASTR